MKHLFLNLSIFHEFTYQIKVRQKILLHLRLEYARAKATATVITLSAYKNIRLEIENDLKPEVQAS